MTCEECVNCLNKMPWNCTTAERGATILHLRKCKDCHAKIESITCEQVTSLTQEQVKEGFRLVDECLTKDAQDQEFPR